MQHIVITFEAAFPVDSELAQAIQSTVDDLRQLAAARAIGSCVLKNDDEYQDWYNSSSRIQEIEIPVPTVMKIEWD